MDLDEAVSACDILYRKKALASLEHSLLARGIPGSATIISLSLKAHGDRR